MSDLEKLEKLSQLKQQGSISETEFQTLKAELLSEKSSSDKSTDGKGILSFLLAPICFLAIFIWHKDFTSFIKNFTNSRSGYLASVKNGTFEFDKSVIIKDALSGNRNIDSVSWKTLSDSQGRTIIEANLMVKPQYWLKVYTEDLYILADQMGAFADKDSIAEIFRQKSIGEYDKKLASNPNAFNGAGSLNIKISIPIIDRERATFELGDISGEYRSNDSQIIPFKYTRKNHEQILKEIVSGRDFTLPNDIPLSYYYTFGQAIIDANLRLIGTPIATKQIIKPTPTQTVAPHQISFNNIEVKIDPQQIKVNCNTKTVTQYAVGRDQLYFVENPFKKIKFEDYLASEKNNSHLIPVNTAVQKIPSFEFFSAAPDTIAILESSAGTSGGLTTYDFFDTKTCRTTSIKMKDGNNIEWIKKAPPTWQISIQLSIGPRVLGLNVEVPVAHKSVEKNSSSDVDFFRVPFSQIKLKPEDLEPIQNLNSLDNRLNDSQSASLKKVLLWSFYANCLKEENRLKTMLADLNPAIAQEINSVIQCDMQSISNN